MKKRRIKGIQMIPYGLLAGVMTEDSIEEAKRSPPDRDFIRRIPHPVLQERESRGEHLSESIQDLLLSDGAGRVSGD